MRSLAWIITPPTLGIMFWYSSTSTQVIFGGTLLIIVILLVVLPLIPGFVNALANNPNKFRPAANVTDEMDQVERERAEANVTAYKPSSFAFFTFLAPGQAKAIIRGKRFRRFIMRYDGFSFSGDIAYGTNEAIQPNRREYWEVKPTPKGKEDEHPIPVSLRKHPLDIVWWWSRYVYNLTGAIFVGIPPFQTVDTYELEQLRKVIGPNGEFIFIRIKNFSDHVRTAQFQFFVQIPGAETNDQVKVKLQYAETALVTNPYRALYDTDKRWASRLSTATIQEVSSVVRGLGYEDVIAKNSENAAQRLLTSCIMALNKKKRPKADQSRDAESGLPYIGLEIKEAELRDAEVNDSDFAKALADVAKSKADAQALDNRSAAEARAIDRRAKAARQNGHEGRRAQELQGQIATVAAAKNGVILNIGSDAQQDIDSKTALLRKTIQGE